MAGILNVAKTGGGADLGILPALANRHGLITGATGTGKTVTLQVMAERFSSIGVPVFMADVKGDLAGLAAAGASSPKLVERLKSIKVDAPAFAASPVVFWDVFGKSGHPVRATISDMGPLLLARMLRLNDTQRGVLTLTFKIADDAGLLLLDMKDLRAMLQFVGDNASQLQTDYGHVSAASIGTIQRGLLEMDQQGADTFFGEPMLDIHDLIQCDTHGKGVINILAADELMKQPIMYSTLLLWLLSELYEQLPEIGDPEKPVMVFFFDEAHLLFNDAPQALLEKIEQVVRLIRSKGVGVFFVTQNPMDVPPTVLGQLGNRVQHALRAFSPSDQKAVKTAADTLRANPKIDTQRVITELGVGEALVSFLDEKGAPNVVDRAWVLAPASRIGAITPAERQAVIAASVLRGHYEQAVDRESAYEKLKARTTDRTSGQAAPAGTAPAPTGTATPPTVSFPTSKSPQAQPAGSGMSSSLSSILFGTTGPRGGHHEGILESAARSATRSMGSAVGRSIIRGVLGSILGGK